MDTVDRKQHKAAFKRHGSRLARCNCSQVVQKSATVNWVFNNVIQVRGYIIPASEFLSIVPRTRLVSDIVVAASESKSYCQNLWCCVYSCSWGCRVLSLQQGSFVPVLFAMHIDQESHFALCLLRAKQLANWGSAVSLLALQQHWCLHRQVTHATADFHGGEPKQRKVCRLNCCASHAAEILERPAWYHDSNVTHTTHCKCLQTPCLAAGLCASATVQSYTRTAEEIRRIGGPEGWNT